MQLQWRAGALLFLALVIASAAQETQAPAPQVSPPTLRITVTLIQLDAVVTDAAGKHVVGLQPGDFEVLQDGQPQKVTYFSYVPEPAARHVPEAAGEKIPLGTPPPVAASQIRRVIALVVDDLALNFSDLVRTREALRQFVERKMEPGDLVAIVRTAGGVAILEQFTTDRRVLLEAIDLLKWHFNGHAGIIPIKTATPEEGEHRADPQILDHGYPTLAMGALATIEQVIQGMKGLPGRKSVVFLSDGMRMDSTLGTAIDEVTDLANRSAVSLYAIDPAGLRAGTRKLNADPQIIVPDTGSLERFPALPGEGDFEMQQGLDMLATRTGGLFYHSRNDIAECITEAAGDQLGYYLLGYSPREGTFEKDGAKAKFHRITVKVRTPGLAVRWKSGFNGVPDELVMARPDAPKTREQQLMDALASPFTATGIKVRLTSFYNETRQRGPLVQSMLHFEAKDLSFQQEADGMWHALVDIVTSAYRGVKLPIQQRQRRQEIRLAEDQYQKALKEGFLFNLVDPMKTAGTFLMRAVVRDSVNQKIGSASQYVQVPDTHKRQLALSGILLRQAPADLVKQVGLVPAADQETWGQGGPALRRYLPGQAILYGFAVINPKMKGAEKEFKAGSQMRLFRDGKLIYTGNYSRLLAKSDADPTRLVGAGVLRLGNQLTPGEYLLQVLVTDESAAKRKSQVAQWVDFEVIAHL
jgi:VWFA-related protein